MTAIPADKANGSTAVTPMILFVLLVVASAGLLAWALVPTNEAMLDAGVTANREHANVKHAEAEEIRERLRDDKCYRIERYYSPVRGTAMLLCQMTPQHEGVWGARILRIASNGEWLGDNSYEATAMAAPRTYFNWVIKRDGYIGAGPDVLQQLRMLAGL